MGIFYKWLVFCVKTVETHIVYGVNQNGYFYKGRTTETGSKCMEVDFLHPWIFEIEKKQDGLS